MDNALHAEAVRFRRIATTEVMAEIHNKTSNPSEHIRTCRKMSRGYSEIAGNGVRTETSEDTVHG